MTYHYYLFGAQGTLAAVAADVAGAVGTAGELRESSYMGGEYFLFRHEGVEDLTVQENWTDEDGELAEPDFPGFPVLLHASIPAPAVLDALSRLPGLTRLRVNVLD